MGMRAPAARGEPAGERLRQPCLGPCLKPLFQRNHGNACLTLPFSFTNSGHRLTRSAILRSRIAGKRSENMERFFGGNPGLVMVRLAILSLVVGVLLAALGFSPFDILDSIRELIVRIYDLGWTAVEKARPLLPARRRHRLPGVVHRPPAQDAGAWAPRRPHRRQFAQPRSLKVGHKRLRASSFEPARSAPPQDDEDETARAWSESSPWGGPKARLEGCGLLRESSSTLSGGRPIAALPPLTTIGRSMRMGLATISAISASSSSRDPSSQVRHKAARPCV